jgi:hypothetical protein
MKIKKIESGMKLIISVMKSIFIFISVSFILLCCSNNHYGKDNGNEMSDSLGMIIDGIQIQDQINKKDSIDQIILDKQERLVVHDSAIDLIVTKSETELVTIGQMCLKFRLKGKLDYDEFCFRYPKFSDVIFPDTSVGILNNGKYRESNYYLFEDEKLLLPICGMNFLLVYVLDLKNKQVLRELERRTYLQLVWVDEKSSKYLVTDSPQFRGDQTSVFYNVFVFNVKKNKIDLVGADRMTFKIEENQDRRLVYLNAKRILLR